MGAAVVIGISLLLPWLTFLGLSYSPLGLLGQDGYFLLVVVVSAAAIGLAVAVVSSAERERSRSLWTWTTLAFGATTAVAAYFLVSYAGAGSQSGLGGAFAIGAVGIGSGYVLYVVGSVGGLIVAIRTRMKPGGWADMLDGGASTSDGLRANESDPERKTPDEAKPPKPDVRAETRLVSS